MSIIRYLVLYRYVTSPVESLNVFLYEAYIYLCTVHWNMHRSLPPTVRTCVSFAAHRTRLMLGISRRGKEQHGDDVLPTILGHVLVQNYMLAIGA